MISLGRVGLFSLIFFFGCGLLTREEDLDSSQAVRNDTTISSGGRFQGILAHPQGAKMGLNQLEVTITDSQGQGMTEIDPWLKPWMPDHGHGSTPEIYWKSEQVGATYRFSDVLYTMPGRWIDNLSFVQGGDTITLQWSIEIR